MRKVSSPQTEGNSRQRRGKFSLAANDRRTGRSTPVGSATPSLHPGSRSEAAAVRDHPVTFGGSGMDSRRSQFASLISRAGMTGRPDHFSFEAAPATGRAGWSCKGPSGSHLPPPQRSKESSFHGIAGTGRSASSPEPDPDLLRCIAVMRLRPLILFPSGLMSRTVGTTPPFQAWSISHWHARLVSAD